MNKQLAQNLVGHIFNGEIEKANSAFKAAFDKKYRTALESRKIAVASKIYSKKSEKA